VPSAVFPEGTLERGGLRADFPLGANPAVGRSARCMRSGRIGFAASRAPWQRRPGVREFHGDEAVVREVVAKNLAGSEFEERRRGKSALSFECSVGDAVV